MRDFSNKRRKPIKRTIKRSPRKLTRRRLQRGGAMYVNLEGRVLRDGDHYEITVTQLNDADMIDFIYHGQARAVFPVVPAQCSEEHRLQHQDDQPEYILDGKGILIEFWPDGLAFTFTVYEGDFINNGRNGNGKMRFFTMPSLEQVRELSAQFRQLRTLDDLTGMTPAQLNDLTRMLARHTPTMVYKGSWADNHISGVGKMTYPNRDVYVGHWQNNMKSGRGQMTYANRDVYDGHWQNNMKSGSGQMRHIDGRVYTGEWHDDHRMVFGRSTNPALSTPPIFSPSMNLSGFGGVASLFSSANVPSGVNIFGRPPPSPPPPPPPPPS